MSSIHGQPNPISQSGYVAPSQATDKSSETSQPQTDKTGGMTGFLGKQMMSPADLDKQQANLNKLNTQLANIQNGSSQTPISPFANRIISTPLPPPSKSPFAVKTTAPPPKPELKEYPNLNPSIPKQAPKEIPPDTTGRPQLQKEGRHRMTPADKDTQQANLNKLNTQLSNIKNAAPEPNLSPFQNRKIDTPLPQAPKSPFAAKKVTSDPMPEVTSEKTSEAAKPDVTSRPLTQREEAHFNRLARSMDSPSASRLGNLGRTFSGTLRNSSKLENFSLASRSVGAKLQGAFKAAQEKGISDPMTPQKLRSESAPANMTPLKQAGGHADTFAVLEDGFLTKQTDKGEIEAYSLIRENPGLSSLQNFVPKSRVSGDASKASTHLEMENLTGGLDKDSVQVMDIKLGREIFNEAVFRARGGKELKEGQNLDQKEKADSKKISRMEFSDSLMTQSYKVQAGKGKFQRTKNVLTSRSQFSDIAETPAQKEQIIKDLKALRSALKESPIAFYGSSVLVVKGSDEKGESVTRVKLIDIGHYMTPDDITKDTPNVTMTQKQQSYDRLRDNSDKALSDMIRDLERAPLGDEKAISKNRSFFGWLKP